MNFRFREKVAADAATVFAVFSDPAFYRSLDLPDITAPEVLDIRPGETTTEAEIRYRYQGDLPPGAGAFITPERLTWIEASVHHPERGLIELTLLPDHYGDRMSGRATHRIIAIEPPETEGEPSCWWETAGSISVRLPFVAGPVERAIIGGLGENLLAMVAPIEVYCG